MSEFEEKDETFASKSSKSVEEQRNLIEPIGEFERFTVFTDCCVKRVAFGEQSLENPETHISGSIENTATKCGLLLIHQLIDKFEVFIIKLLWTIRDEQKMIL